MIIRTDWTIDFDEQRIRQLQGEAIARLMARPSALAAWTAALADARRLVRPAAAWDIFPIRSVLHERIVLENGVRIGGGPVASVIGGAEQLIVGVCTVGPEISQAIEDCQRERAMLQGFLLDELGSWAVDQVRQQLCRELEQDARRKGLRVSASLSPGESEWPVSEQAVLFNLVDGGAIGVTLKPSMFMTPLKSLTMIMGAGSQPMGVEGASNCDFCTIKERCNYRARRELAL